MLLVFEVDINPVLYEVNHSKMKEPSQLCPCCSNKTYLNCCSTYHDSHSNVDSAEALMRSRFSAYAIGSYHYVLETYHPDSQVHLSEKQIEDSDIGNKWLGLEIVESSKTQVEFKAYYQLDNDFFLLHELSNFIKQNELWYYVNGTIFQDSSQLKPRRNDPCPCQSGKKFKKCCQ